MLFAGTSLYVLAGDMFIPASMLVDLLSVELTGTSAYVTGPSSTAATAAVV